jgi:hypothetical protein
MDAVLTIESEEAVQLAEQLAKLTGESVEEAVTHALRERFARRMEVRRRKATIMATAAEIRSHLNPPLPTSDHSWLYGDDGLPV